MVFKGQVVGMTGTASRGYIAMYLVHTGTASRGYIAMYLVHMISLTASRCHIKTIKRLSKQPER